MQKGNNDASLVSRLHVLLKQKQVDKAMELLAQAEKELALHERERHYVRAWCAIMRSRWDDAAEDLCSPFFSRGANDKEALLSGYTERRRRPRFLLLLGRIAVELGYAEEAREHFLSCLALLDERRMNVPELRLQAQQELGMLALQTGWPDQAALHYATVLRLCAESCDSSFQAKMYASLCEAHFQLENFSEALAAGQQGLALLDATTQTQSKGELLLLLARISLALKRFSEAVEYAQEARQLARQSAAPSQEASALLTLAELWLFQRRTSEARACCQEAFTTLSPGADMILRGKILFCYGKIAEAEWHEQPERTTLAEEAHSWYEQAQTCFEQCAPTLLAEVLRQFALFQETQGSSEQALASWKTLYLLTEQQGRE